MSEENSESDQAVPRIVRPWESDALPPIESEDDDQDGVKDNPGTSPPEHGEPEDSPSDWSAETSAEPSAPVPDFSALERGSASVDAFTHGDYSAATTREYQGLAEEVSRMAAQDVEPQAVSASMPGVGSGLVGFDDITGIRGPSEMEVEPAEQQRASDLTVRAGTAVVLVGIFLGSLLMGRQWFTTFVIAVMLIALGEFYATTRTSGYAPAALFGFLGMLGVGIGTYRSGVVAIGVSLTIVLVIVGLFLAATGRRNPVENASLTVLGAAWVGLLGFAVAIVAPAQVGEDREYVGLILFVVLVTAAFDAASYFAGKAFGQRLMAPQVSPKKTWEGFLGGAITALLLAAVLSTFAAIFPFNFVQSLTLAGMVIVLAPLGDAAESVVKRSLDVKDMGSLLPGHGGMLDRIDALLFVVPGAFLLFRVYGLV